jgi:glutamyl-tRNA reductase
MILLALGCNTETAKVGVRERLAFHSGQLDRALDALTARFGCEAVVLSTCNRVEVYAGQVLDILPGGGPAGPAAAPGGAEPLTADGLAGFLAEFHDLPLAEVRPHLYVHHQLEAVRHLFRVAGSLDSLLIGEGQIAGQVKAAYERACGRASAGPLLHALFRHARQVARRVRTETGIARGHVSVSSAAVDYVRQVFDHFADKTILVIGAGKMGELTLKHLRQLHPRRIVVTNRSPEKARAVAAGCGGEPVPWDKLDDLLAQVDIVLSTTDAPEPIVTRERYRRIAAARAQRRDAVASPQIILDIAVPRDFDPRIHDGDRVYLFNIDDLKRIRDATLADRRKHVAPAEAIVEHEAKAFLVDWARRRNGPVIARLRQDLEAKRQAVVQNLLSRLNGKLTEADRKYIEGAFRLLQNQFLHGPISALTEETHAEPAHPHGHTLLEALRKLFRLQE